MALRALEPTVEQCLDVKRVLSEGKFSTVAVGYHKYMLSPDDGLVLKTHTKVCQKTLVLQRLNWLLRCCYMNDSLLYVRAAFAYRNELWRTKVMNTLWIVMTSSWYLRVDDE